MLLLERLAVFKFLYVACATPPPPPYQEIEEFKEKKKKRQEAHPWCTVWHLGHPRVAPVGLVSWRVLGY